MTEVSRNIVGNVPDNVLFEAAIERILQANPNADLTMSGHTLKVKVSSLENIDRKYGLSLTACTNCNAPRVIYANSDDHSDFDFVTSVCDKCKH